MLLAGRRHSPCPFDWGYGMTVCIGAKDHGENIILASDHKVNVHGGEFTADDTALKCKPLTATGCHARGQRHHACATYPARCI